MPNSAVPAPARARARLTSEAVDAHEPRFALPRAAYREHVIADEVSNLNGAARSLAEAFAAPTS